MVTDLPNKIETESDLEQFFRALPGYHPDDSYSIQLTRAERELPEAEQAALIQRVDALRDQAFESFGGRAVYRVGLRVMSEGER